MKKIINIISCLAFIIVAVNCVPTSVLVDTKDTKIGTTSNKVKRAPEPLLNDNIEKMTSGSVNNKQKMMPHKRGINPQILPVDLSNDILVNNQPNGVWDDSDNGILYQDLQEIEQQYHRKAPYGQQLQRRKSYENLQNLLNSQLYSEPVALPLEYPYRYYGDRKKRSNKNQQQPALRLKRETKLSAADLLTLLALVESGRRSNQLQETQPFEDISNYINPYDYPYSQDENNDWLNSWTEPSVQYYGVPPYDNDKYSDLFKDGQLKLNNNKIQSKRFMVSKKKRTSFNNHAMNNDWQYGQEKLLSEPIQLTNSNYDFGRYNSLSEFPHKNYRRFYQK